MERAGEADLGARGAGGAGRPRPHLRRAAGGHPPAPERRRLRRGAHVMDLVIDYVSRGALDVFQTADGALDLLPVLMVFAGLMLGIVVGATAGSVRAVRHGHRPADPDLHLRLHQRGAAADSRLPHRADEGRDGRRRGAGDPLQHARHARRPDDHDRRASPGVAGQGAAGAAHRPLLLRHRRHVERPGALSRRAAPRHRDRARARPTREGGPHHPLALLHGGGRRRRAGQGLHRRLAGDAARADRQHDVRRRAAPDLRRGRARQRAAR